MVGLYSHNVSLSEAGLSEMQLQFYYEAQVHHYIVALLLLLLLLYTNTKNDHNMILRDVYIH